MAQVRGKDTKPELVVRNLIHRMGFRYRLHNGSLPGKPDLVFPRLKKVIFVHGCYWHGHERCRAAKTPKSNRSYWLPKLARNKERDKSNFKKLKEIGWRPLIIWECQIKSQSRLSGRIKRFLGDGK